MTGAVATAKYPATIGRAAAGSVVGGVVASACLHKKKVEAAAASTANENWKDVD